MHRTLTSLPHPPTLELPNLRVTFLHALPNLVEGKVIPVLVFIGLLELAGTTPALLGALAFSVAALGRRLLQGREVSGILVLTTVGLVARTVAALATGSLVVYFIQPTVSTALVGGAFLISVLLDRPLAERLMLDVCPVDEPTRNHAELRRFLSQLSLWWAFTSCVNFSITLWLLLNESPTTFVLVKSFLGPVTSTVTLGVGYVWFRRAMARSGTRVVFASSR